MSGAVQRGHAFSWPHSQKNWLRLAALLPRIADDNTVPQYEEPPLTPDDEERLAAQAADQPLTLF